MRFTATTRTAEDAAKQIGTEVERIVKSLVFVSAGGPVVVLCSGRARVDEKLLAIALGGSNVRRATADEGLLGFDEVWAAAGLPDAVFPIAPRELVRIADAEIARVAG